MRYETIQFLRQPKWLVLFIGSIIISIILPRAIFSDFYNFPSMIYFVMSINLLFLFFGSEEARLEKKNHLIEQLKGLPFFNKFMINKLIYWVFISFIYYLIFYIAVILYIQFSTDELLTAHILQNTLLYTIMVWFIPFYFSILIGYLIYTLIPSILSYIFIVIVWFLIMPYNSMLGFIPNVIGAWVVNGDPNIEKIISVYQLENMKVNNGYYVQRGFMLILLTSLFALLRLNLSKKLKASVGMTSVFSLLIPFLSPYAPQIDNQHGNLLNENIFILTEEVNNKLFKYNLENYSFTIKHHGNMHELSYDVKVDIKSEQSNIQIALWDDFNVSEVKFNGDSIEYSHNNNLVSLSLPQIEGELTMSIETDSYSPIGPTTFELIGTTPWYPMNPLEAVSPYYSGKKEKYEITLENKSNVYSNLSKVDDRTWRGEVYGPTILKGDFINEDDDIFPIFKDHAEIELNKERIYTQIDSINIKLETDTVLTCQSFIFTTTLSAFNANPDECYNFINENIIRTETILSQIYLDPSKTFLFEAVYYDMLMQESWQSFLKQLYNPEVIDTISNYYQQISEEERNELIKKWYKDTKGTLTPEQMIRDMEDIYVTS